MHCFNESLFYPKQFADFNYCKSVLCSELVVKKFFFAKKQIESAIDLYLPLWAGIFYTFILPSTEVVFLDWLGVSSFENYLLGVMCLAGIELIPR